MANQWRYCSPSRHMELFRASSRAQGSGRPSRNSARLISPPIQTNGPLRLASVFFFLRTVVMNLSRRGGFRLIPMGLREPACDIKRLLPLGGVEVAKARP